MELLLTYAFILICFFINFLKFSFYRGMSSILNGSWLTLMANVHLPAGMYRWKHYFDISQFSCAGWHNILCRCMLRGFRLHRCPYWIRPSITISNHNGVPQILVLNIVLLFTVHVLSVSIFNIYCYFQFKRWAFFSSFVDLSAVYFFNLMLWFCYAFNFTDFCKTDDIVRDKMLGCKESTQK